jgi:predicted metal-dependent peptidase
MEPLHPKIIFSIDYMITDAVIKLQYYGEFCQFINFKKTENISTCGVNVDIQGMRFYYNEDFLNEITQEEMNFIMIHEIFHLLWDHKSRELRCGFNHDLSNIVQDMIINEVIKTDIIERIKKDNIIDKRNAKFAEIPKSGDKKVWVLTKPKEYTGRLIYEEMYLWLVNEKKKYDDWVVLKDSKCPVSDYLKSLFEQIGMGLEDFLDSHLPSDVPEEYKKSIIENIKNNLKNRGLESGEILKTIGKLNKSKKDYLKDIKIGINELFGSFKEKSITKRNRRSIEGLKGKRKDSYALNVILDVSGSMEGYFEKSLSYVFQNNIILNIIQCDTKVKNFDVIKNKYEFKKYKITGLGGTSLQPGVNYIIDNKKLNKLNTLILTDGHCPILNVKKLKKVLVISIGEYVRIIGKAKQIKIKE